MVASERTRAGPFQYPLADRRACGVLIVILSKASEGFQYPLADRRACGHRSDSRK